MAVSVAAISPPVQDSAAVTVSLRARHASRSFAACGQQPFVDRDRVGHGRLTVAAAVAAIPSPLPMKPSPSLVVALTLT